MNHPRDHDYGLIPCDLFEWLPFHCRPRWYHGFAFYNAQCNERLFVLIPFNLIVRLVHSIFWRVK